MDNTTDLTCSTVTALISTLFTSSTGTCTTVLSAPLDIFFIMYMVNPEVGKVTLVSVIAIKRYIKALML